MDADDFDKPVRIYLC